MDEAATVSEITKNQSHSKVDARTLTQKWRIGLGPAQQTLNTTTQIGIRHDVHPLTSRYKTDITHGYNARRLNKKIYFDTLFPKFRALNGNTCVQLFTDTEFIRLQPSKSKAEAGNCLNYFIYDIRIPMNMNFDHFAELLGERNELMKSIKKHYINWNVTELCSHWKNRAQDGIKRNKLIWKSTMQRTGCYQRRWYYCVKQDA